MIGSDPYLKKGPNWLFFLIYLVFGVYLVAYPFSLINIPEIVSNFDKWIIFVGGILILLGAINYFRVTRK